MAFHGMFLGETGSGKTFKARTVAGEFRAASVPVLSFIPEGHHWSEATRNYHDPERFIAMVNASRRCAVFVEFSDASVEKFDVGFSRLATWSRNLGHRCYFIAQRHTQIAPTIRDQCRFLWLFRVGFKTADILAEEYVDRALTGAPNLKDYHYFLKKRGVPATMHGPGK